MPKKDGKATHQERAFIAAYVDIGDARAAADRVGYAHSRAGYAVLARPEVQEAVRVAQAARLAQDILPKAVAAIERVLTDPKMPAGAVVQAAKLVLDRCLGDGKDGQNKAVHEMTGDELSRAIDHLRREAAARAAPVIDLDPCG